MGTFLKVGVAAVPVPLPVSPAAGGPAASPSREPKPVPCFCTFPALAEDKVTSAQQPQATSQGSPSPGGTATSGGKLLHCHAEPLLPHCLFQNRNLAASLHKQKAHYNVFPQTREPLASLRTKMAAALNISPQGLKIPGSISQTGLKGIVPGLPLPLQPGKAELLPPSTHRPWGGGMRGRPQGCWG